MEQWPLSEEEGEIASGEVRPCHRVSEARGGSVGAPEAMSGGEAEAEGGRVPSE